MNDSLKKKCPICGNPTRSLYGRYASDELCLYHGNLSKAGKIKKDPTGIWVYADSGKPVAANAKTSSKADNYSRPKIENGTCLVCGKPKTSSGPLCRDCYHHAVQEASMSSESQGQLIEHYQNLKANMYRMYGDEAFQGAALRLYAIAYNLSSKFHYGANLSFFEDDIPDIRKKIEAKEEKKKLDKASAERKNESLLKDNISEDMHMLDSDGEVKIDNAIWHLTPELGIMHVPHQYVTEIDSEEAGRTVKSDWKISFYKNPGCHFYIEYWGMKNDKHYEENKKEKKALYERYGITYIGIEADEISDQNALMDRLRREIYKIKRSKGVPE